MQAGDHSNPDRFREPEAADDHLTKAAGPRTCLFCQASSGIEHRGLRFIGFRDYSEESGRLGLTRAEVSTKVEYRFRFPSCRACLESLERSFKWHRRLVLLYYFPVAVAVTFIGGHLLGATWTSVGEWVVAAVSLLFVEAALYLVAANIGLDQWLLKRTLLRAFPARCGRRFAAAMRAVTEGSGRGVFGGIDVNLEQFDPGLEYQEDLAEESRPTTGDAVEREDFGGPDYPIDVCISRPGEGGRRTKVFFTGSRELVATLVAWQRERVGDVMLTWGRTDRDLIPLVTALIHAAGGAEFRAPRG